MGKRQCHSQSYVSSSCPLLCQKNLYGWQQGCLTWAGKGRLDTSQVRDLWAFWELWCHLNIEIVTENKIFFLNVLPFIYCSRFPGKVNPGPSLPHFIASEKAIFSHFLACRFRVCRMFTVNETINNQLPCEPTDSETSICAPCACTHRHTHNHPGFWTSLSHVEGSLTAT